MIGLIIELSFINAAHGPTNVFFYIWWLATRQLSDSFNHSRISIAPLQVPTTQWRSRLQHGQKEQFKDDYRMCRKAS